MKKVLFFIALLTISSVLTSFSTNNRHISETEANNDYVYYTAVKAWEEPTESTTLYIYYKEGNGVRKYYSSCGDDRSMTCLLYVKKNELYKSSACNDFRRNYKYRTYHSTYYFNCERGLPYLVE